MSGNPSNRTAQRQRPIRLKEYGMGRHMADFPASQALRSQGDLAAAH
jgi:hypothetical protein